MVNVRELLEGYPNLMERKQILYSKLLTLSGEDPLQEESLYHRLYEIDKTEELLNAMFFESVSLSSRQECILQLRIEGKTLQEIGDFFNLGKERIRQTLMEIYKLLANEFKDELQGA